MTDRYGKERIKRGLLHFVFGKGISSIAGFLVMVLVVRALPIEAFAAYSVLIAFVELLTALSGLGLVHLLIRYVPELYSKYYKTALRQLVSNAVALRTGVLLAVAMTAWLFADELTPIVGLTTQLAAFKVFLLVVVLRSSTHFLALVLESTLHQGLTQAAFSVAALARLTGMTFLLLRGDVQLVDVIWVEAISDGTGLLIVAFGVIRIIGARVVDTRTPKDDCYWLRDNLRELGRFALAGYLQHLAIMPYGGNTNRLVGGHLLSVGALANFGFAQSLYDYVKRYLPAQLLVGLIRPIVVARYCEHRHFADAARICSHVVQINILLIGSAIAILAVGGSEALGWLSAGKYGADAASILAVLFLVLLLETQRQQLDLLVQTAEQYRLLIPSNILLSCSVFVAIGMLPSLGAIAFPLANSLSLLFANAWVQHRMSALGYHFHHDWLGSFKTVLVLLFSVLVGLALKKANLPWFLAVPATITIYGVLGFVFCGEMVLTFVHELTRKAHKQLPELNLAPVASKPRIAFGVLSSKQSSNAIDEIAAAVFPHPVYVHHDFSKQPDFSPTAGNIRVLPDPVATAWGNWSLVEASFRLMKAALEDQAVTHFQLLSEACLPVRNISEFEDFLVNEQPDVMMDIHPLKAEDALYSHGWRYLTNKGFTLRVLRRASIWIWGKSNRYNVVCSVNLRQPDNHPSGIIAAILQWAGRLIIQVYSRLFQEKLSRFGLKELAIGGQWFGASRRAMIWLVSARVRLDYFTKYFELCHIPDESYIHTLVLNAQLDLLPLRVFPSNHAMCWKTCGTGPDLLGDSEIPQIRVTGKFFARKFPLEAKSTVRQQILGHLA